MAKKLEGCIEGVDIGDYLCLETEKGHRIGGFVLKIHPKKVKLSLGSPKNEDKFYRRGPHVKEGEGTYNLKDFVKYNVIKDPMAQEFH